jgi:lipopolysaccharide biosynthesis glycosyltransferase
MNSTVPIVFSSNNYFVPYMAAMIQSILENSNPGNNYRLFILHRDISASSMARLRCQTDQYPHFSLEFTDVGELVRDYKLYTANRDNITAEAYFRLLIPELFSGYEKVIYLDGDMICLVDINDLYRISLNGYPIASSRDILGIGGYYRPENHRERHYKDQVLKISSPGDYFISGMLVINIEQFRKTMSAGELLDFAASREWKAHDQDVLNVLYEGRTLLLPMEWDFTQDDGAANFLPEPLQKEYFKARESPKIVHFASPAWKPWLNPVNVPYFELFWKYAARTPFLDIIIDRMRDKGLIGLSYRERILSDVKNGNLGLRFILQCLRQRFF